MLSATTFQGYKKCCMLAMDVWCFSKSTARIDLEKHQTRLHYWGISLCNFGESPLQFWVFLLYTKHACKERRACSKSPHTLIILSIYLFLLSAVFFQSQSFIKCCSTMLHLNFSINPPAREYSKKELLI